MAIGTNIPSVVYGFSKPLYSTWLYYKPDKLLIDCGEGAATRLGNFGYGIERIFLTHGHIDHIAGLPSFIWARATGMGDRDKPLQIYYPGGDKFIPPLIEYIRQTQSQLNDCLPFELSWTPIESFTLELHGNRKLESFPTNHIPGGFTLGYKIVEARLRLQDQYKNLESKEIQQLVKDKGKVNINETYISTIAVFGGDGIPLKNEDVGHPEILFHEATLVGSDRVQMVHSTIEEAIQVAAQAKPKSLVLYHISSRYDDSKIYDEIRRCYQANQCSFDVWTLIDDKLERRVETVEGYDPSLCKGYEIMELDSRY